MSCPDSAMDNAPDIASPPPQTSQNDGGGGGGGGGGGVASLDVLVGGGAAVSGDQTATTPHLSITPTSSYNNVHQHYSEQRIIGRVHDAQDDAGSDADPTDDRVWGGIFEPYVKDCKPLKIMDWRQMCSHKYSYYMRENDADGHEDDSRATCCMASPDPRLPTEALGCNITVQCRRARARPASLMSEEEKRIREARRAIDAALSIVDRSGDETNLFLGQEDQITTRMSLGDVINGRYDSDLMNVCVAQETILASPQSEISTSIVVENDGTVRKEGDGTASESLAMLASWIRAPAFLLPLNAVHVREINLWYAPKETRTNTHHDGNHNILIVLRGTKTIELCPPGIIKGSPIHSEHSNHPALWRATEVGGNCPIIPSFDEELQATRMEYKRNAIVASVSAGEAIFIPEGWWHRVESSADCLAINFWFDHESASTSVFARPSSSHMLPYQTREIMRAYVDANFARFALVLLKEAQGNGDTFLPSRDQKMRGADMVIIRTHNQIVLGDGTTDDPDVDWKRVAKEGYSDEELRICLKNISTEVKGLQKKADQALDPTIQSVARDLSISIDSIGLMLSIFLIYVQPGRENDRRAVINLFANLFPLFEMQSGEFSEAQRNWLYLEIVLRLQRQACFVLSQVWELHRPSEEAEESYNSLFSSCSDADSGRRHILGQVENFKQEVVHRLIFQDLMLISALPCGGMSVVVETDDRCMKTRKLAARGEYARSHAEEG